MATKKTKKNRGIVVAKAKWAGFVNVYLAKTEKQSCKDNQLSNDQIYELILNLTEMGYKVSQSWSEPGGFFTVTCYGQLADNPNAGLAMSLKHSDLVIAFTALEHCLAEAGYDTEWSDRYTTADMNDW